MATELQAIDLDVASALERLGYCVIMLDDWTRTVADAMSTEIANPSVVVPQAIARLMDAEVVDRVEWRVCQIGGIWLKLSAEETPPSHMFEEPFTACAYVVKVDQLKAARGRHERGERFRGGFVKN